jgi:hypothetical protein
MGRCIARQSWAVSGRVTVTKTDRGASFFCIRGTVLAWTRCKGIPSRPNRWSS